MLIANKRGYIGLEYYQTAEHLMSDISKILMGLHKSLKHENG